MLISIKYVNFPKPGGKYGSIVGQDGTKIMVPPDLLGLFRSGQTVEVGVKTQTWGAGTDTEKVMTVATTGPHGQNGLAHGQSTQPGYQAANLPAASQRANTGFQPRVVQGGGGLGTNPADDEKSRNIFVCGVVQQAMSSGKFTASEIRVLTQAANEAFDLIRPPAKPAPAHQPIEPPPGLEPGDPGPELQ